MVFEEVIFDKVSYSPKEDKVNYPITIHSKFIRFFFPNVVHSQSRKKETLGQCFSTGVPENPWVP